MKKTLLLLGLLMPMFCLAQETVVESDTVVEKEVVKKEKKKRLRDKIATADEGTTRHYLPVVGKEFPIFSEIGMDGKVWSNSDLLGHVSVFYLWYNGCVQALSEMGELAIWKQMFPDVLFFSVTWHDVPTTFRIVNQRNFTWTHLCKAQELMSWVNQGVDEARPNARDYPVTIVVDQQGIIRRCVSGTDLFVRQETLNCIRQYR